MKFRKPLKITSRISSITNSFVQAIIPTVEPTDEELREALAILDIDPDNMTCAYCGRPSTDWDHLRPLVRNKRPTGFINELRNLVPSCGPCNQSKSGHDWRTWMTGEAKGSPTTRGVPNLAQRIARLEQFVKWGALEPISFEKYLNATEWEQHWTNLEEIASKMRNAQDHAEKVRQTIFHALSQNDLSKM